MPTDPGGPVLLSKTQQTKVLSISTILLVSLRAFSNMTFIPDIVGAILLVKSAISQRIQTSGELVISASAPRAHFKYRVCATVQEMRVGPSEPDCRRRLQTI